MEGRISFKELDQWVKKGGAFKVDGWHYDIIVDRLEQTGFKFQQRYNHSNREYEGSVYSNENGIRVIVATRRMYDPMTFLKSIISSNESN